MREVSRQRWDPIAADAHGAEGEKEGHLPCISPPWQVSSHADLGAGTDPEKTSAGAAVASFIP